ncbi:WD40-repeat-containing domain protein [Phlyctochytrium arcticum]|nr:WD40-repeat-containing domain protein [Phlyctochytrium arcticum]
MVKLYVRYRLAASFGIVASGSSNASFGNGGKIAIAPALEDVVLWDIKTGTQVGTWSDGDNRAEVTCVRPSPNGESCAVGYSDGAIRIWETAKGETNITFNGHRGAVSALSWDPSGTRLVSGSKDTDIIVWDVIAETGLYRLRGHKDQVTAVRFLTQNGLDHIVSASKDTLLKFWDLSTQHCVETVIAHRGEVWTMDVSPVDQRLLVTGAADGEVRVWDIDPEILAAKLDAAGDSVNGGFAADTPAESSNEAGSAAPVVKRAVKSRGTLERQSKERLVTIQVHASGRYIGAQGADRLVEIYRIRSEEEIKKKVARLKKRQKEKKKQKGEDSMDVDEAEPELTVVDQIPRVGHIRCSAKIRSFDFGPVAKKALSNKSSADAQPPLSLLCALSNNTLETHAVEFENKDEPTRLLSGIEIPGHRSDIRCMSLSSDDQQLVTGSADAIKVWNAYSRQCLKTLDSGYALCCEFLPGNNFVVVGTKTGELQLFDLARSAMIESIKAHEGAIWTLQVRPDRKGLTTGSQDKDVKFWDLGFVDDPEYSNIQRRPTLVHRRTLRMSDDVLCIRYSPDGKILAVALLDSTVKVLYADSLTFFLSLYGHKLPIMSMDISSDSTLIATGSADKTIKIWGLDFGDCHKSLHAHQDSVMAVRFVWGTHQMFSASKDRSVKYWDADKFELIMKMDGHHGEVWALAVAKYGLFVVTGAHDRSIRVWEKTDDQFMLEEEREREMEEVFERNAAQDSDRYEAAIGSGVDPSDLDNVQTSALTTTPTEVAPAGKKTADTLKAGERLIEALDVWAEERATLDTYLELKKTNPDAQPLAPSPFIVATGKSDMAPEEYVLFVTQKIRSADLDEALLILPMSKAIALLKNIVVWIEMKWNLPLTSRILFFLLRTHQNQLVATKTLQPTLIAIRSSLRAALKSDRDIIGFNSAGLQFLKREIDQRGAEAFYVDVGEPEAEKPEKSSKKKSSSKRKHANKS